MPVVETTLKNNDIDYFNYDTDGAQLAERLQTLFLEDFAGLYGILTGNLETFIRLCSVLIPHKSFTGTEMWEEIRGCLYYLINDPGQLCAIWIVGNANAVEIGYAYAFSRSPNVWVGFINLSGSRIYNIRASDRLLLLDRLTNWPVANSRESFHPVKIAVRFVNDKREGQQIFTGVIKIRANSQAAAEQQLRKQIDDLPVAYVNVTQHSEIIWDIENFQDYCVGLAEDGWKQQPNSITVLPSQS